MEIISRAEAAHRGLPAYFTGEPCSNGHIGPRYTKNWTCLECKRGGDSAWRDRNPERARELSRRNSRAKRARATPEIRREQVSRLRAWVRLNKPRAEAAAHRWRSSNGWLLSLYATKREERVRRATPPWADQAAIAAVYARAAILTAQTGVKYHVDHEIPLKGVDENGVHVVCGLHVHNNLRPLPAADNLRKSNRFLTGD